MQIRYNQIVYFSIESCNSSKEDKEYSSEKDRILKTALNNCKKILSKAIERINYKIIRFKCEDYYFKLQKNYDRNCMNSQRNDSIYFHDVKCILCELISAFLFLVVLQMNLVVNSFQFFHVLAILLAYSYNTQFKHCEYAHDSLFFIYTHASKFFNF